MRTITRSSTGQTVELSLVTLLAFFFWMTIPFAVIVTVWIELGDSLHDSFHRVHLRKPYSALVQARIEASASTTDSKNSSQFVQAKVDGNPPKSQRGPRHKLFARKQERWNEPVVMGYAENAADLHSPFSSPNTDLGAIH